MGTFLIGTLVLLAFAFAGYKVYKDKKSGNCCSGNCSNCKGGCKY
ncbi:FeoB-associated Cys-rich membrane protein [Haloimpatiens sp. FM7315]